jgi:urease accessory protein
MLQSWIGSVMERGNGFVDAVLFAHAHRFALDGAGGDAQLRELAALAAALAASKERHLETTAQGRAFLDTTRAAWPCAALDRLAAALGGEAVAYPVAVGVAAAGHGIAVEPALTAFLHAIAANLVSAGMRLVPIGQTDGARVLAACEAAVASACARALACPLDDIGSACFRADIAAMRHETQYTRLFRT